MVHVVLVLMRMCTLANGLVCPGVVNNQGSSATVETATTAVSAAICRSVSRCYKGARNYWNISCEFKGSILCIMHYPIVLIITLVIEPMSDSLQVLKF